MKLEILIALKHLGCELTDSDKMFIREETSKPQSSSLSSDFKISENGYGMNILLLIVPYIL